jgi:hypothetical protein
MTTWWSSRQGFVFLLAAFVATGFALSAVQASNMSVKMSMATDIGIATDMGMSSDGDCAACSAGSDDHGNPMYCPPVCITPILAVLPQDLAVATNVQRLQPFLSPLALLHGRSSLPDPYPPRPSDLA